MQLREHSRDTCQGFFFFFFFFFLCQSISRLRFRCSSTYEAVDSVPSFLDGVCEVCAIHCTLVWDFSDRIW